MKKLFLKVSAIAGMMVCSVSMSSCTHDEIDGSVREPVSKDQVAMSLFGNSGEDGSRTQLGENNNVFFCKGDSISVFNDKGGYKTASPNNDLFVANKAEDFPSGRDTASVATFNGEANIGAQYFAILYPYQKDATATGVGDGTAAITATIPATQKAKEGNFDPHASVSVGLVQAHAWDVPKFYLKNVGGLLKFTAGGTGYNKIEITGANNENIAGKVSITVSGAVPTITDKSAGVKKITLTDVEPGKIYYVGILPQTFDAGIIMDFFNGTSKVGTKTIFNGSTGPTVNRSRVCNVGKVTPEKPEPVYGPFTVNSAGTKVKFAPGNLYWDGSDFKFETNQWDTKPTANVSWVTNHVSHFYWSKDASVAYAQDYSGSGAAKTDVFFTNGTETTAKSDFTVDNNGTEEKGKWRTLSTGEWKYLLIDRKVPVGGAANRFSYGEGKVNGVKGLIILPDDWDGSVMGTTDTFNYGGSSFANIFNDSSTPTWSQMESAGCVFLPCAGCRNGSTMRDVDIYGYYQSSSPHASYASYACYMIFTSGGIDPQYQIERSYGFAVRLVCPYK